VTLSEQPPHVQSVHPQRRLGALPEKPSQPRLYLDHYLASELVAAVPNGIDYLSHIASWQTYGNDRVGNSTAAAAAHIETVWASYGQGRSVVVPEAAVMEFYAKCSGYVPAFPASDRGARLQDCLGQWQRTGLGGHQIAAYFEVEPSDPALVRTALYLFGALYVRVALPRVAHHQLDAGQPWDVVADDGGEDGGGHCVHLGAAFKDGNYGVTTWGRVQEVTPAWWGRYVTEVWAPVSTTWVQAGLSPAGLDTVALNQDFETLTGRPGPFPPSIVPPPTSTVPVMNRGRHEAATGPSVAVDPETDPVAATNPTPSDADVQLANALRRWLTHHQWTAASRALAKAAVDWLTARNL
jgi:hypothetical protein